MGNSLRTTIANLFFVLGESSAKLPFLTLVFLGVSLIDLVGLGLVGPYLALVLGSEDASYLSPVLPYSSLIGDFNNQELLTIFGLLLLLVYLLKTICAAVLAKVVIKFGQHQQVRLKTLLMSRYLGLPYQDYILKNQSYYTNNINVLTTQFANLVMVILQLWGDLIVALVIVGLLLWTNPQIFLLLTLLLSVWLVGFDFLTRRQLEVFGRENVESSRDIFQHTDQALRGFKEIKVFALHSLFVDNLHNSAKQFASGQIGVNFITMLPKYLLELVIVGFLVAYCLMVVWSDHAKEVMLPTLGVFGVAAVRLLPIIRNFSASLNRIRSNRPCLQILADDLKCFGTPNKQPTADAVNTKVSGGIQNNFSELRFVDFNFHYPKDQKLILNDVNLAIRSGEKVGVIGRSGAGKSTLVNCILGFLKPTQGSVSINGVDLACSREAWWQQIAYVPQDTFVIDDTIEANIALGSSDVDAYRLHRAIKNACLAEDIRGMPEGLNTSIGGGGGRLSGGQRQRLALARAFYTDRKILILDEAMSALDHETEKTILDRILNLTDLTVIIISHREKTLTKCNRILEVSKGRLLDQSPA